MTQLLRAKSNKITREMREVALSENIPPETLILLIKEGKVIIPKNKNHKKVKSVGIGESLRTKVNANIGTSEDCNNVQTEIDKLLAAINSGADTVMDLSIGGDLDMIRKVIIDHSAIPVGTVPIYQNIVRLRRAGKDITDLNIPDILRTIEKNAKDGVDFITVHCGLTTSAVRKLEKSNRIMEVVSRGGSILLNYIRKTGKENPFYTAYNEILKIAKAYDVTLSLGDGLRPGCIHDATDSLQIDELLVLGELQKRAVEAGVQVMIEGPGHIPLGEIKTNVQIEKKVCNGAPFYVLGPIATDIAPGYDHIVSAIGGAIAAACGADFLCFVTPSEHLRLPTVEDVKIGVVASKIAAHIGDIEKGRADAVKWDNDMAIARSQLNWEKMFDLAIEPERPRQYRAESPSKTANVCTMCGDLCAMKKR